MRSFKKVVATLVTTLFVLSTHHAAFGMDGPAADGALALRGNSGSSALRVVAATALALAPPALLNGIAEQLAIFTGNSLGGGPEDPLEEQLCSHGKTEHEYCDRCLEISTRASVLADEPGGITGIELGASSDEDGTAAPTTGVGSGRGGSRTGAGRKRNAAVLSASSSSQPRPRLSESTAVRTTDDSNPLVMD